MSNMLIRFADGFRSYDLVNVNKTILRVWAGPPIRQISGHLAVLCYCNVPRK